jgi:hypothetical protein
MDSFMANQMNEVEGTGSQSQKAVVEEPKKAAAPPVQAAPVQVAQAEGKPDAFGDAMANYLTNG